MRAGQIRRHLGALGSPLPQTAKATQTPAPAGLLHKAKPARPVNLEFSPRDYITYLLSIDAEIEHCLMVQYLYAAYSLGGPQVPAEFRDAVRDWQEVILGIAKEEMGHLISVQNVLRVIGAPLHFEREDYPWDAPFYPFPFTLEPLTLDSLAKYVYAESPVGWDGGELGDEIRARVHA
ncbi:MAG TPA: ferritin-like domain-containing protein, partial [Burkholderiaceae bacterium]